MMPGPTSLSRKAVPSDILRTKDIHRSILSHRIKIKRNLPNLSDSTLRNWRYDFIGCTPLNLTRHASSVNDSILNKDTTNSKNQSLQLDWNIFFQLRKKRRWYQQAFSFGSGLGGVVGGTQILMHSDLDALLSVAQIPLDPFITLGLLTFTFGGLGWLLGPIAGTALFNWKTRGLRAQIEEREKEFYRRVRKHRVDPSNSSMANPVPDYYGEKVSSVQDYRQWLKDCRAFNKKRTTYIK